ncbi:MAG: hypothetical protein JSS66_11110 [Armatimonadetes bacterium]|nr:hypothetical protein [Armatimonadota bacterium]
MAHKTPAKPAWWKNTFFWFAGALFLLAVWGLVSGESVIRDPGQVREGGLVLIYLTGAVVMLVHGYISHQQAVQHYEEAQDNDNGDVRVRKDLGQSAAMAGADGGDVRVQQLSQPDGEGHHSSDA